MCKNIYAMYGNGRSTQTSVKPTTGASTNTTAPPAQNGNGVALPSTGTLDPVGTTTDQTATPTGATQQAQHDVATEQDALSFGLEGLASLLGLTRGRQYQRGASTNVGTLGVRLGQ